METELNGSESGVMNTADLMTGTGMGMLLALNSAMGHIAEVVDRARVLYLCILDFRTECSELLELSLSEELTGEEAQDLFAQVIARQFPLGSPGLFEDLASLQSLDEAMPVMNLIEVVSDAVETILGQDSLEALL